MFNPLGFPLIFVLRILSAAMVACTIVACSANPPFITPIGPGDRMTHASIAARLPRVAVHGPPAKGYGVLYEFQGSSDGGNPEGGVIVDKAGRIFGTTSSGGGVFELVSSGGSYAETTILVLNGYDGTAAVDAPIEDKNGNLFVAAANGGEYYENGTVVKLSPTASGYQESGLFSFNGTDGGYPDASPAERGNRLYVTTERGGKYGAGVIVELAASNLYATDVYDFQGTAGSKSSLVADARGVLYGTTFNGGSAGFGAVYKFVPSRNGGGTVSILWSFLGQTNNDGAGPLGGVIVDKSGNIYGTTFQGGDASSGNGVVFKLTPSSNGYNETILHTFHNADGAHPSMGLTANGDLLYGATFESGSGNCACGTIFQVSKTGSSFSVLHNFQGSDGAYPYYGNLALRGRALYGTTAIGGSYACNVSGCGVVFRFAL